MANAEVRLDHFIVSRCSSNPFLKISITLVIFKFLGIKVVLRKRLHVAVIRLFHPWVCSQLGWVVPLIGDFFVLALLICAISASTGALIWGKPLGVSPIEKASAVKLFHGTHRSKISVLYHYSFLECFLYLVITHWSYVYFGSLLLRCVWARFF